ncbi:MAG: hypothetical protein ACYC6A_12090 [Armatimonadota bacterium]
MKHNMELVGIFPVDFTVRVLLPEDVSPEQLEACRLRLAGWFNGAVVYHVNATWLQDDGRQVVRQQPVVESHAGEQQITAHRDELEAMVHELRAQWGDDVVLQVGPLVPPTPPAPEIFAIDEAADYLGMSVPGVKKHIYQLKDLHPEKTDPAVIFTRFELDRFKNTPRRKAGRPKRAE